MKRSFAYAATETVRRMQDFGELFKSPQERDVCARKHGGSPESVEAHKTIRGALSTRREAVYDAIKRTPIDGVTVDELAEAWNENPNAISGRFSELARDGRIVKIGRRKTRSGCSAAAWKAI